MLLNNGSAALPAELQEPGSAYQTPSAISIVTFFQSKKSNQKCFFGDGNTCFQPRERRLNFTRFKNPTTEVILRLLLLLPDFYALLKPRIPNVASPPAKFY